jgi:GAF domain-containing protein
MATQRPALSTPESDFAGQLLAEREVAPRAAVIAQQAAALLEGCAINVYVYNEDEIPAWPVKGRVGEATVENSYEAATLTRLAETREPLLFSGASLARELYAHLNVRRTIASLAYVPILLDEVLIGAIEAISFDCVLHENDIATLDELTELSALALATGLAYENERNSNLDSITRLTQLYDVEKVFNSTLQMSELMPIICSKVRELLNTQAVNLYMVEDDDLVLMARDGEDETLELESGAEAIVKQLGDTGEPVVIADAADARLAARNGDLDEGKIVGLMAAPVVHEDSLVAVLECVNKTGGTAFDEDDLFFLTMMTQTAAGALHNASLMEAEKKIEILETLVAVSNEITSTLNLERVLQVVVNAPQKIITFDRAAVALEERGKLQVRCISGQTEVVSTDPKVRRLREMLEWSAMYDQGVHVYWQGEEIIADREETRTKFQAYFIETGLRAWYSVPLADDQGRLGVLSFESANPDFLSDAQLEFLKVLASQATVAVRNASLYKELPLIGMLQPMMERKRRFMATDKRRRTAILALAHYYRFTKLQYELVQLFDGNRNYDEVAALFIRQTGVFVSAQEVREFADSMEKIEFWYKTPYEESVILCHELAEQRHKAIKHKRFWADVTTIELWYTEVADTSVMRARVYVSEPEFRKLQTVSGNSLRLDALWAPVKGTVAAISPTSQSLRPGLMPRPEYEGLRLPSFFVVDVILQNADGKLRDGMTGTAKIFGRRRGLLPSMLQPLVDAAARRLW